MIRRQIKILGIGLVAAMALSALAASAASAQEEQGVLTTEFGNAVTLTGEEVGESENRFTMFGSFFECPGSTYTGHDAITHHETETAKEEEKELTHELIPGGATASTITPHYKQAEGNCQWETPFGSRPLTIDMTGCDYVLHVGKTTFAENENGTYGAMLDIECPKEKHIDVTGFEDGTHSQVICKITIKEQTGLKGLHVTNTSPEDFHISGTAKGIHVQREGLCTLDGKGTTTGEGQIDVSLTVEAHEELGEPEGITFSDERC